MEATNFSSTFEFESESKNTKMDKVSASPAIEGLMWRPSDVQNHQMTKLREKINSKFNVNLENYTQFHKWSCENYDQFWGQVWDFCNVISWNPCRTTHPVNGSTRPEKVIDKNVPINQVPKWFEGVQMNYAENLLRHKNDEKIAFYYTTERKEMVGIGQMTFGELKGKVAQYASALRKMGIKRGDIVAGYLPNCPEAIIAMAATASIGGIWTSTSPDFGVSGVLDRLQQINPKVIFSVEAVSYNMKIHDHLGKLRQVSKGMGDNLLKTIIVSTSLPIANVKLQDKEIWLEDFLEKFSDPAAQLIYEKVPFDHPLFIMYSSGTTGKPKCMVHSVGGTLLKHLEEHQIQGNRDETDVLMYYTTTGWMMWNWMVSALALGTTLVLYDGSPLHPHPASMWDLVDECGITVFGTSAKWIAVQEDRMVKPRLTHKLTTLKAICSTGSPLKPHSYDYVYRDIKGDVLLASISGGTDIIACFMGENSTLPVFRGEIQSCHLGCALQCWDAELNIPVGLDEPGELVCTKPFPSMPVRFWNDPDFKLYSAAYFDKIPGVWAHGDFIHMNPKTNGGIVMLGRSDGTLNPSGVRFGSAEIYNIVEPFPEFEDSLCVGQRTPDGEERVILFLKMAKNFEFEPVVVDKLRKTIRTELSARHVPTLILPISDIPYTVNGKKVEVAVKKILAGQGVKNQGALANPESLDLYKNIPEVQTF